MAKMIELDRQHNLPCSLLKANLKGEETHTCDTNNDWRGINVLFNIAIGQPPKKKTADIAYCGFKHGWRDREVW